MPALRGALRQGRVPGRMPRALLPVRLRVRGMGPHVHGMHAEGLRRRDRSRHPAGGAAAPRRLRRASRARRAPLPMCHVEVSCLLRVPRRRDRLPEPGVPRDPARDARASASSRRSRGASSSSACAARCSRRRTRALGDRGGAAARRRRCSSGPGSRGSPAGLEGGVGEEVRGLRPSFPADRGVPVAVRAQRRRVVDVQCSEPVESDRVGRGRSTAAPSASGSVTSTPDTHQWHESRQSPSRGWPSSRSNIASSSSTDRPIVPPAPAEFSISSQVRSVVRPRSSRSAGTARLSPFAKPEPR